MGNLTKDLRYSLRTWRKSPGFTLVVLLTVTLSVGMTTAIFSVVNGVLLKPLPYPEPDRVIFFWNSNLELGLPFFGITTYDFAEWKAQSRSFQYMTARQPASFNLTGDGIEPERLSTEKVSEDYFSVLGLRPLRGRLLLPAEQAGGGAKVVVLNRTLWERRFSADPDLPGKSILLNGEPYTVVGIVDDPYRGAVTEIWTPLGLNLANETRGIHTIAVLGRLRKGGSVEQAQAEMDTINERLAQQYPDTNKGWQVGIGRMHDLIVQDVRPRLYILLGAVLCVLLIACANLMNLFLARISSREREIAIRAALGAGRGRVVRQLLTETLLLAVVGGGLGVLLAGWGTKALLALNTKAVPRPGEITVDGRVLLFALGASVLTGLIVGLWPALRASRSDLHEPLKEGGRGQAGGLRGRLVRNGLVLLEVAVALVLLVGAGLLIKSFGRLQDIELGFNPDGALTARLVLPEAKYADEARQIALYDEILQRVQNLPGVAAAGFFARMPLADNMIFKGGAYPVGQPPADPNDLPIVNTRMVSPGTFRAMGMKVVDGRPLQPQDGPRSTKVVVINETLARRLWPGQRAVGQQAVVDIAGKELQEMTVVGVVADIKSSTITAETDSEVFLPHTQQPVTDATLIVRTTASDPASIATAVRSVVASVDHELPISDVQTLDRIVATALSPARFGMILLSLFAGLALVLASVGVYGVMSYSVTQRTQEIGIRMAMGADRRDVLRMILQQSLIIALVGVFLGLAGALGLTQFLAGQLFGVSARDPLVFVAVASLLTSVALIASYLPARRATGVDPLLAMR